MTQLSYQMNKQQIVECPCGNEHPYDKVCEHEGQEKYSSRFRLNGIEGIEEGVVGPEGTRVPLTRKYFETEGRREDWFDRTGRAHFNRFVPYKDLEDYTNEDFAD